MEIKILGTGCTKCQTLGALTHEAVEELGLTAASEKVTDPGEIASWGVMTTPALVIDDAVVGLSQIFYLHPDIDWGPLQSRHHRPAERLTISEPETARNAFSSVG